MDTACVSGENRENKQEAKQKILGKKINSLYRHKTKAHNTSTANTLPPPTAKVTGLLH